MENVTRYRTEKKLYSIGEFSRATGLTIKTLRFYHDQDVLIPTHIDAGNGYRYYDATQVETARVIFRLRELDFTVKQVAEIVFACSDESDILAVLENRLREIADQMQHLRKIRDRVKSIVTSERESLKIMSQSSYEIEVKTVPPTLIAGVRMRGQYSDCGKAFGIIGRHFGRKICGKAMMLCYDTEFKERDADFEPCMPIRNGVSKKDVDVREIPGGRCVTLVHLGAYSTLTRSYDRVLQYVKEHQLAVACVPSREVYLKGPGMIFKGDPNKYLTEIQFFVQD